MTTTHALTMPPATRSILARVLDEPALLGAVRALPARALATLVGQIGLEDAGEIVALATPEQLLGVLDEDLWRSPAPGADECFDDERFALWLEVLLESGERALVEKLAALPEELVTLGLERQVLVLDMDELAEEISAFDAEDAERLEKALDGALSQEIGRFRVVSRQHDGWDAVLALLMALDESHHGYATRLLQRLADASQRFVDEHDDLCDALTNAEMIASDAAAEREDRRAAAGFVAPAMARSFLALARSSTPAEVLAEKVADPVTRAYFREFAPTRVSAAPSADERCVEELAFLVNVLIAGDGRGGRTLRPIEAVERVILACERGLKAAPPGALERLGPARLFRLGWREAEVLWRSASEPGR